MGKPKLICPDGSEFAPFSDDPASLLATLIVADEAGLGSDLKPYVLCSDTFGYACADAEDIDSADELQALYEAWDADPRWGTTRWCILKRKRRPIREVVDGMKRDGAWDEACEQAASGEPTDG